MAQSRDITPLQWTANNLSIGGGASCSRAAAPGVVHICTAIVITALSTSATALGAIWQLLDGANVLLTGYIGLEAAVNNFAVVPLSALNIPGTAGNAMTLSTGGNVGVDTGVSLIGYDQ